MKEEKLSIRISAEEYQLIKNSRYTQYQILKKGLDNIENGTIELIMQKEHLQENIKQINIEKEKTNQEKQKVIEQLEMEKSNRLGELDRKLNNLHERKQKLNQELNEINKNLNIKFKEETIKETVTTVQEYKEDSSYNRAVRNIIHAYKRSGFSLDDFISLKENYIYRLCQSQGLNIDKLISLMKKQLMEEQ